VSGAGAHPPITPLDPTREPEAIAEAFSPVHARVYALARDGWLAMRRPVLEIAVTTVAWPCAGGFPTPLAARSARAARSVCAPWSFASSALPGVSIRVLPSVSGVLGLLRPVP